jgi:hypothetical protein
MIINNKGDGKLVARLPEQNRQRKQCIRLMGFRPQLEHADASIQEGARHSDGLTFINIAQVNDPI